MGRSGGGGSGGRSGGGRSGGGFSGGGRSSGGFSGGRSSGGSGGRSLFSGGGSGGSGSGGGSRNRGSGGFNIGPIVPIFINRERRRDSGAPRGADSGYGYPPNGYPPAGSGAPYESAPNNAPGYGTPPYGAPPNGGAPGTYPSSPYPTNAPSYAPPPVGAPSAGTGSAKKGCGCSTILLVLGLLIVLSSVVSLAFSCAGTKIDGTPIVERAPLAATAVVETGYYTDEDGDWVHSPSKLENGLREFYRQTGVQPYVYILPNGTTTSTQELGTFAEQRYDELFSDEGHFLLVFCDDGDGGFNCGYAVGSQARSVMDDAAIDVLADNLDKNYRNYSLDEEEIFSKAFADTAETIMKKDDTVYTPSCPSSRCWSSCWCTWRTAWCAQRSRRRSALANSKRSCSEPRWKSSGTRMWRSFRASTSRRPPQRRRPPAARRLRRLPTPPSRPGNPASN